MVQRLPLTTQEFASIAVANIRSSEVSKPAGTTFPGTKLFAIPMDILLDSQSSPTCPCLLKSLLLQVH